jgi:tetratricopeptide (TPR) repeat protein
MVSSSAEHTFWKIRRTIISTALFVLFLVLAWNSAQDGIASLLYAHAASTNKIGPANTAVRLSPHDPDSHYVRGVLLESSGDSSETVSEYKQAALLRPEDYVGWLNLARVSEINGDTHEALLAAKQAVKLSPFYSQPHWFLGNLLIRSGQSEEGFAELRLAAVNNPSLIPAIIDLAWQLSHGEVDFVQRALKPTSAEGYKHLATYFIKKGKTADALALLRTSSISPGELHPFVSDLLSSKQFMHAHELWKIEQVGNLNGGPLVDPGFEQPANLDHSEFGWRSENKTQSLLLDFDYKGAKEGHSSLRIDFKGDSNTELPILSQIVMVESNSHYQLEFAVRSDALISANLPEVTITDATDDQLLGPAKQLPADTSSGWQVLTAVFETHGSTEAINVKLVREHCAKYPCPIFGRLWLDSFVLRKLD